MKRTFSVLFALLTICMIGCNKTDLSVQNDELPSVKLDKKLKGCVSAGLYGSDGFSDFNPFRKVFDDQGRVTMIVAPVIAQGLSDSVFLKLYYGKNKVYFINQNINPNAPWDSLTAEFDNQGRLRYFITSGIASPFENTEFVYTDRRLTSMRVYDDNLGLSETNFYYDSYGNVIRYDGYFDYEFTYDLTTKIEEQVYVEYAGGYQITNLVLAQIMGWTPDLDPVNKRIHTTISDEEFGVFYDIEISGHVVDSDGKLISYYQPPFQMNLAWTCRKGNVIN